MSGPDGLNAFFRVHFYLIEDSKNRELENVNALLMALDDNPYKPAKQWFV